MRWRFARTQQCVSWVREGVMSEQHLRVLELIEAGQISVEEGVKRLNKLAEEPTEKSADAAEAIAATGEEDKQRAEFLMPWFVRVAGQIVFGAGVAMLAAGGLLLAQAYGVEKGPGLGWGWLLFVLGLLIMVLGWWLQRARWLYVRVREPDERGFTIAVPIPLLLLSWLLRIARPFVPQIEETGAEDLILSMREEIRGGNVFLVEVDDEDGEEVTIAVC